MLRLKIWIAQIILVLDTRPQLYIWQFARTGTSKRTLATTLVCGIRIGIQAILGTFEMTLYCYTWKSTTTTSIFRPVSLSHSRSIPERSAHASSAKTAPAMPHERLSLGIA